MSGRARPAAHQPGLWALIGIVTAIALWELWVRAADVKTYITIAPSKNSKEIFDNPSFWIEQTWLTAWHSLVGVGFALALAILVGAVLAASRPLEWATQPLLVLVMVTPWVAYITSVVNWLGPGTPTILFMVAFVTFPALVFAAVQGMRSADIAAREVLASVDAPWTGVFWKLRVASALPAGFTAVRVATGLGLAAAYFSEGGSVAAGVGLGEVGRRGAQSSSGYEILWASIVCAALLGVTLLVSVTGLERRVLRWHASQRSTAI